MDMFNQCHHHCRRLRVPSQNDPIWEAICFRGITETWCVWGRNSGTTGWTHLGWISSLFPDGLQVPRTHEYRPQYSGMLLGQQKTWYPVWTFLVHSVRRVVAFSVLVMIMGERITQLEGVQQHFQCSFYYPSWSFLFFNKPIRDYLFINITLTFKKAMCNTLRL